MISMRQPSTSQDEATQAYEVVGNVIRVPLVDIFVDPEFNCRGHFTTLEVHGLGMSIKAEGQQAPLIIQPVEDVDPDELPEPCHWKFRLIAGHRRYAALSKWVGATHAKCCVQYGLTREQARVLNFTENLQRQELNILQEAQALAKNWPIQETRQVARLIGKPKRWVETRRALLALPDYVQRKAASDPKTMSQYAIEMLSALPEDEIEPAFQRLVTTVGKADKAQVVRKQGARKRPRGIQEVGNMMGLMAMNSRMSHLSTEEMNYIASALLWASKIIDSKEFLETRLGFPEGCVIVDSSDKVTRINEE